MDMLQLVLTWTLFVGKGRFLEDELNATACGINDGHTVLLVPKPNAEERRGHRRSSSTGVYGT